MHSSSKVLSNLCVCECVRIHCWCKHLLQQGEHPERAGSPQVLAQRSLFDTQPDSDSSSVMARANVFS